MAKKEKLYTVEITDIFEPEQEEAVISAAGKWARKTNEELQEFFKTTDTLVVKKLSESDAKTLMDTLNGMELTVRMYTIDDKVKQSANEIRCPKCGFVLEYPEWRCPECYYEFPDFELEGDEEPDE